MYCNINEIHERNSGEKMKNILVYLSFLLPGICSWYLFCHTFIFYFCCLISALHVFIQIGC